MWGLLVNLLAGVAACDGRFHRNSGRPLRRAFASDGEQATLAAVTTSLTRSFPYVLMYRSIEGWGYHYLASMSPIHVPTATEAILRMPEAAQKDRLEWKVNSEEKLTEIWSKLLKGRVDPASFTMSSDIRITDDRPFNEYCLIRYLRE